MSNDNTSTAEKTQFTFAEVQLAELREDRAKAQAKVDAIDAKIAKLEATEANAATIKALKPGDEVAYVYGRALNKRVLNGTVLATKENEKAATQLKVEYGSGFDAEYHLIDATALLFTTADIEKAQADIDATVAAAKAAAKAEAGR
jgi:hypothetical protein